MKKKFPTAILPDGTVLDFNKSHEIVSEEVLDLSDDPWEMESGGPPIVEITVTKWEPKKGGK
jgi:hypothetical protein